MKKYILILLAVALSMMSFATAVFAEISEEDKALYEKYTAMLDSPHRIPEEIAVSFKPETPSDEKYQILFDACAEAYGTDDAVFINSKMEFIERFYVQKITVPDEVIVETMVKLSKNPQIDVVEPNFRAYLEALSGDVNEDGIINAIDYVLIKRSLLGTFTLSETQDNLADVNTNGYVDTADYAILKRMVLGTYIAVDPFG